MWQYRVTMLPVCCTSTYQPQPVSERLPSTSQLLVDTLQTTRITVPAAAAWIGVLRTAPRSTPSWVGRAAVRYPLTSGARTGSIHAPVVAGGWTTVDDTEQVGIFTFARTMYASETK